MADRIRHGQHGEAERERYAVKPDAELGERRREHGTAAASERKPERADGFGGAFAHIHQIPPWLLQREDRLPVALPIYHGPAPRVRVVERFVDGPQAVGGQHHAAVRGRSWRNPLWDSDRAEACGYRALPGIRPRVNPERLTGPPVGARGPEPADRPD